MRCIVCCPAALCLLSQVVRQVQGILKGPTTTSASQASAAPAATVSKVQGVFKGPATTSAIAAPTATVSKVQVSSVQVWRKACLGPQF